MTGSGRSAGPTGTKVSVNVLDYGAVADHTTDCQRGGLWQRGGTLSCIAVQSDTDWAVSTVRYTPGPQRVLDLRANGRRHASRRRDNAGDAEIAAPVLGSFNNGEDTFTGLLATAVIIDGALSDEQLDTATRFLLHHHQIPV
ncbi:hypothetical protein [Streptomyces sp. NPDC047071]|uniref:hypothetical protein n=1 Tax=Streptomyces sp. NPDC047071 TaxID=3154808 RepID=UPI00345202CD